MEEERSALVQQRIKKMLENKKRNNRESGELTKRLKSNVGDRQQGEEEEDMPKPSSSMKIRRPTSAMKPAESSKTISPNLPPKSDIDVRPIIGFVFEHGAKLRELLRERKGSREECLGWIMEEELFLLRVMGVLRGLEEEGWNEAVEGMVVERLRRRAAREEVVRRCEEAELRVGSMLEARLRDLQKH